MAKNYEKKLPPRRNPFSSIMVTLLAFAGGYGCATLVDGAHLSQWVKQQFFVQHTPLMTHTAVRQAAQLPKPKFEFYTLLAKGVNEVPTHARTQVAQISKPMEMSVASSGRIEKIGRKPNSATLPSTPNQLAVTPKTASTGHGPMNGASTQVGNKGVYLIQVASFRNFHEAQKMKAALVMKGFDVSVTSAVQQNISWYRVMIGPYASLQHAEQVQLTFNRSEHISGMIRKMDV